MSILNFIYESLNPIKTSFEMEESTNEENPNKKIKIDNIIKSDELSEIKKLESGQYSSLSLCINPKNEKKYVVKIYSDLRDHSFESLLHRSFDSEYVAEYVESDFPISKAIVTKYYENGDFLDYSIEKRNDENFRQIFCKIAFGLKFLKSQMVIHRDIKPENIFLDENLQPRIGDFGFAIKLETEHDTARDVCGTILYVAPEIVGSYNFSVDVWSLGVLFYSVVCGNNPFHSNHLQRYSHTDYVKRLIFPKFFDESLKELIKNMLNPVLTKRFTIEQVCDHHYFSQ